MNSSRICFLLCFALGGFSTVRLSAEPMATEPLLELPKFIVTDERPLPPPEAWRYARIPGLEILSGVSDRETQKLLRDFQLFDEAIGVVWPALKAHHPVPMSLILCGAGGKFSAFVPAGAGPSEAGRASLLLQSPEQVAIVLNFGVKTIELAPSEADVPAPSETAATDTTDPLINIQVDYYRQLYREYVRYLLGLNQPRLPAWLEEGLAQLLMGMKVDPKFIEFARLEDPNLGSAGSKLADSDPDGALPAGRTAQQEQDFNSALHHKGLIPLAAFFAVGHDSLEAGNSLTGTWSKQAQALVHMWLYGEGKKYNRGFAQFVARSVREPVTEAMFKECFKMGYADMLTALRIYISDTAYQHQQFEAKKGGGLPEPAPLALRDATQAEVGRIKGEAQVLAGHPEQARDEMLAPYARGVTDGPLFASLGILEKSRGETARARKFLEAAAQLQVVRPRVYLELAGLRYAQVTAAAGAGLLSAEQTRAVTQPLLVARQQPPPLPEVYELMAEVWMHSAATPAKSDLGAINQGVLLFQRRPLLLLHAAELNGKYGDPAEALTMANYGLKLSQTPEARQAFEEVKAALPPVPVK
jgi:hypothetical protein